jgi:hypothetical protein
MLAPIAFAGLNALVAAWSTPAGRLQGRIFWLVAFQLYLVGGLLAARLVTAARARRRERRAPLTVG